MPHCEAGRLISCSWIRSQRNSFLNHQKTKKTVVPVAAIGLCKQTKEQEDISYPNGVVREVGLRSSGLAKGAPPLIKHGVMMAKTGA